MTYPDLLAFLRSLPDLKSTACEEAMLKDVPDVSAYVLRREGEIARQWLAESHERLMPRSPSWFRESCLPDAETYRLSSLIPQGVFGLTPAKENHTQGNNLF